MKHNDKKALVVVGSKHGSTFEIGTRIAKTLDTAGFAVSFFKPAEAESIQLDDYELVMLGSAVYAGHWRKDIKVFIENNASDLKKRNVFLFSSGPVGKPPMIDENTDSDGGKFMSRLGAKQHRIFAGKIDMKALHLGERLMIKAVRAPEGDYRDWKEIESWVKSIIRHKKRSQA